MIEPIDSWEADLWPVFDRLKSAMDKQEQARLGGTLTEFAREAKLLFAFFEEMTWLVYSHDPARTEWVYLTWKSSRGINQWYPDVDLPLKWRLAERAMVPVPTAELVEQHKAKYQWWKDTDKQNSKDYKAQVRAWEKEQKKAEKARKVKAS